MKNEHAYSVTYEQIENKDELKMVLLEQAYDLLFELMENEYGNDTAE